SPQFGNQAFPASITAKDAFNTTVTNFSGPVTLACFATGGSPVAIAPTVSGNFTNGQWSGGITAQQSASSAVLRADDSSGHAGLSNPFNVVFTNQPPFILVQPTNQT